MAHYQHYRASTAGIALGEALSELKEQNLFTEAEEDVIWRKFDRAMTEALASNVVDTHLTLKGSLHHYRFCDNVWQFFVKDAQVKFDKRSDFTPAGYLKVVACDYVKPTNPKSS
ncbi:hypothetical protein GAYE_SCF39G5340 [Galdieria yellowstonensis]|uniref:Transcription initiation factor IIA subunit 2 n=1 Tax=Galdieria yellowstonensis TaxID=3028027 RepID=A0AAV9IJ42_9RHOD|nr:hypothetical protein GAYE_SCF39G5340 [Galdieria yellowstonensis]